MLPNIPHRRRVVVFTCLMTFAVVVCVATFSIQSMKPVGSFMMARAFVSSDHPTLMQRSIITNSSLRLSTSKRDLAVHYMSDEGLNPAQRQMMAKQPRANQVPSAMEETRLADDYRFCVKEAPMEGPFNFIKESKNPCWFDENSRLLCLPYFYLAGVSKSGTTDLHARILMHPEVFNGATKEKHWLDYKRYFKDQGSVYNYSTRFFTKFANKVEQDIDLKGYSDTISSDGTPCYFFFSLYWPCYHGNRGLTEPIYTNADVIHTMNPRTKIILSMRDPVKRLYSRYVTLVKNNETSPMWFHQTSSRAIDSYTHCIREWSPRHCAYNGTLYAITKSRLQEGMYSIFLKDWLKVFPRDQMLIFKFEDYASNLPTYMETIFDFLELAPVSNKTLQSIVDLGKKNVRSARKGEMMPETMDLLQKFYRPYNIELQKMLGQSWWWGY